MLNKELKKESIEKFKDNLSNLIKARYKTESYGDATLSQNSFLTAKTKSDAMNTNRSRAQSRKSIERRATSKNNEVSDDDYINTENLTIYGKHIDHLSAEILTALSNDIKKSGINKKIVKTI